MIKMLPNEQLRRERQRRGWSRQYVAEQIGVADPKTIGRWERGVAFPSAHFLQRVCTLFGMLAQDLGLFPGENEHDRQAPVEQFAHRLNGMFSITELATVEPSLATLLVEVDGQVDRNEFLLQLKQRLSGSKTLLASDLDGLPGTSKVVLARGSVYNDDFEHYTGGDVLYILFRSSQS